VLIISAFFTSYQGTILFGIYILGIVLAAIIAIILKKTMFRSQEMPFVMELPPYRIPTFRNTLSHTWHKGAQYLRKMGGIILVASLIIWALGYFPRAEEGSEKKQLEQSFIGHIGKFVEPVMQPLGFDWKISVSLIAGGAAKEVVVSTMGVLYASGEGDENTTLIHRIQQQAYDSGPRKGEKVFTPLVALSLMIFVLIYFPCVAVIAAIKKESGKWKWALFVAVYTTVLAWTASFVVFQLGSLLV